MLLKKLKKITNKDQHKSFLLLQILISMSAILEVISIFSVLPFVTFIMGVETINVEKYLYFYNLFFKDVNVNNIVYYSGFTVIILFLSSTIFTLVVNTITVYFSNKIAGNITNNLYKKYLSKEWLFHALNPSEKLISTIVNDASRINSIIFGVFSINSNLIKCLFIVISIYFYSFLTAIILTAIFVISYMTIYFSLKNKLYATGVKLSDEQSNIQKKMTESFGVIKEIIISSNQSFFVNYFSKNRNKISQRESFILSASFFPRFLIETVGVTVTLLLLIYFFYLHGDISEAVVTLAIFAFASLKLIPSFQQIFFSLSQIKGYSAKLDRVIYDLTNLEYDKEFENFSNEKNAFDLKDKKVLKFEDISFLYPNSSTSSLEFEKLDILLNSKIAIAGESGSGKTTFINLFTGLIYSNTGNIFIDKIKLDKKHIEKFQSQISLVPQNIFLLDETILNNILIDKTKDQNSINYIEKIIKICDLSEFINSLPNGLNTQVGEKGVNLSGGQKQKIGIARCLFANKQIIILDEATNSMDAISEKKIIKNIIDNYKNKTLILISHNYSLFENFDNIVFLEKGKINQIGTYDILIKKNPKFKLLANYEKKNEKVFS